MNELILTIINLLNALEDNKNIIPADIFDNLSDALDDLLKALEVSDTDPNKQ